MEQSQISYHTITNDATIACSSATRVMPVYDVSVFGRSTAGFEQAVELHDRRRPSAQGSGRPFTAGGVSADGDRSARQ